MIESVHLTSVNVTLGNTKALDNVSAHLPAGKIIGLLGPSGAGKTTLMRVITGRQRAQSGQAAVLGIPAGSPSLRGRIGYMPQSAAVYQDLTVRENMRYFAAMLGVSRKDADSALAEVDLVPQAKQLVATLSGGQRSRVSLAIALLGQPDVLVLDEPTVGVDPVLRQKLWRIFRRQAAEGKTLFVSSHVMDEASRCDYLLLIRRGTLLAQGTPEELCQQTDSKTIEAAFLALVGGWK
jgi:ABC-2 type transport system ATP-binding protein